MFLYLYAMVKSLSNRIAAISMAMLLFLSSTGISMDVHYCQDQLRGVSFFGAAKSCQDNQMESSCQMTKMTCLHEEGISQSELDDCCNSLSIVIEKSDVDSTCPQLVVLEDDIQLNFVTAFVTTFVLNRTAVVDFQPKALFRPPLPDRNVQVLYQTFLI